MTGAGRAFCAGAELSQGGKTFDFKAQGSEDEMETWVDAGGTVALRIYNMKKLVIAAINGPAAGGGLTLTLPMDIRLASEEAKLVFPFTRRGIVLESCSSWFLPRIVGISRAADLILSGRVISAKEAFAYGLVNEIVAPDALINRAREIALETARNTSAISVALCRQLLWKMLGAEHPKEAYKIESRCLYWAGNKADAREGVGSFLEKRPANFTMKASSEMPEFYPWWAERPFDK